MPMNIEARRLAEFVDRDAEMRRFCELLDSNEKQILLVTGEGGIGKSSLMLRMVHECRARTYQKAEIVCGERIHSYLDVMRKIRDDVGPIHFGEFTELVNFFYPPKPGIQTHQLNIAVSASSQIAVAQDARFDQSTVRDMAGVIVKDFMVTLPSQEMAIPEHERVVRLTDQFLKCLGAAIAARRLIVFFDAIEKMTEATSRWVWERLLSEVKDSHLPNASFVLMGRTQPNLDHEWRFAIDRTELKPLGESDIRMYLMKRRFPDEQIDQAAHFFCMLSKGKPSEVAQYADTWEERLASSRT